MSPDLWEKATGHRAEVFSDSAAKEGDLLEKIERRLKFLAYELPRTQNVRHPVQLDFTLCNKDKPCTHCPHPRWLRWIPNPVRFGKYIPARLDNPGRVLRGNSEALQRYREAKELLELRQEILEIHSRLSRKVISQWNHGRFKN